MNNTIKLIIEIPKENYERYKKTQSEFGVRESVAINSIVNGIPLNDVKAETNKLPVEHCDLCRMHGLWIALAIIDKYGRK